MCSECGIWNHVDDRGTYSAVHADDCSHLVEGWQWLRPS